MPKYRILGRHDAARIPAMLPPDYRDRARLLVPPGRSYTVILFAHDTPRGVVTSAAVRRALRRVADAEPPVAVGRDFTREATELLGEWRATLVRLGEYGW